MYSPLGGLWMVTCTLNPTHIHKFAWQAKILPGKLNSDLSFALELILSIYKYVLSKETDLGLWS